MDDVAEATLARLSSEDTHQTKVRSQALSRSNGAWSRIFRWGSASRQPSCQRLANEESGGSLRAAIRLDYFDRLHLLSWLANLSIIQTFQPALHGHRQILPNTPNMLQPQAVTHSAGCGGARNPTENRAFSWNRVFYIHFIRETPITAQFSLCYRWESGKVRRFWGVELTAGTHPGHFRTFYTGEFIPSKRH